MSRTEIDIKLDILSAPNGWWERRFWVLQNFDRARKAILPDSGAVLLDSDVRAWDDYLGSYGLEEYMQPMVRQRSSQMPSDED